MPPAWGGGVGRSGGSKTRLYGTSMAVAKDVSFLPLCAVKQLLVFQGISHRNRRRNIQPGISTP